ncbi:hypothetical protein [Actinokineospora diospyrosa]|uniref:Uncharacterized protein n=1 Tax=Actinokineospora diospyrosa TaxID=103728 RepID=A0ABT1I8W7_9PSEU|nr:hypothetical protein [Actinokineospora diospyrosa]MCP2268831.1 hypothetical protein [Actinokineospora diospyrosa]
MVEFLNSFFQIGLPVIAGLLFVFMYVRPAVRLLNRTVYRRFKLTRIFRAVFAVGRSLGFGLTRKELYRAACMRAESELLNPRPVKPDKYEFRHRYEYRAAVRQYRIDLRDWLSALKVQLSHLMKDENGALITVPTCFDLAKAESDIVRYFRVRVAGNSMVDATPEVFQSTIRVEEGFVAPLHLLAGLLSRFDEDWKKSIDGYSQIMTGTDNSLENLRSFQANLFTCWSAWGPSAPFGTCDRWIGQKVLQFGYGDENNSIALVTRSGEASEMPLSQSPQGGFTTLAVRSVVVGVLKNATTIDPEDLCAAQQPETSPGQGNLVLQVTKPILRAGGRAGNAPRRYYSAYIWAILVICGPDGKPESQLEPWRNMLTFFEHGNVADELTYRMLKEQLATKIRTSVETILAARPDVVLSFACAIDECGCGKPIEFPAPLGQSVKETLFGDAWVGHLTKKGWAGRVRQSLPAKHRETYAACQLSQVLTSYLAKVAA